MGAQQEQGGTGRMHVELHGSPPPEVRAVITAAGLESSTSPDAVVLIWPDEAGLTALRRLSAQGRPGLALIAQDDQMLSAAIAGAAGSASATDPRRLRLEVECHLRFRRNLIDAVRAADGDRQIAATMRDQLIAVSPDPVVCADPRGRITIFSASAERSLGYRAAHVLRSMHVTDIYANPEDARRVLAEIRCSLDGVLRDLPIRLRARSGEHIPVLLSAAEIEDDAGQLIATVGVFRDQRAEDSLRQRLNQATAQLIQSERRASEVAAAKVAAHELNQPLTALMGMLEMLELEAELPDIVRSRLERMYRHMDRMADIVRGFGEHTLSADSSPGSRA